jgi:hypothetical protein
VGAAVLAAQQVREARRSTQAQMAAEFFRRWDEDALVEARRLVARYATPEELTRAYRQALLDNSPELYVFYRELDFFEQLAALERSGAFDVRLIELMVGPMLVQRWDTWQPALVAVHGEGIYPLFQSLAERLRATPATKP